MLWKNRRQSSNVDDRRGRSGTGIAVGGGLGTIIIVILALLFGADPRSIIEQLPAGQPSSAPAGAPNPEDEQLKQFVSVVLADTEDVWSEIFTKMGQDYPEPTLILFSNRVDSACGMASAAVGPFYCPGDQKLYIDLTFYEELRSRHKAPGDFAQAYVIAHEVGHHIQNLLGATRKLDAMRGRVSKEEYNKLSVRLELQADFYAGVWAHHAKQKGLLEAGDIEEALNAASAIGDDRLQKEGQGYVVPDSFTHGSSEQRMRWFRRGFDTGDIRQGDTFNAKSL